MVRTVIPGVTARLLSAIHKVVNPRHQIGWRDNVDLPLCRGDIVCRDCGHVFWCRS